MDSGNAPDQLPARISTYCSADLAKPVLLLISCVLISGTWARLWCQRWVAALCKKKSVYQPDKYCGIHLTAQLSKVVERLLKMLYSLHLLSTSASGPSQYAYILGRGARDALAILALRALTAGRKIGVYCPDVTGAFDRVHLERLVAKLREKGLHPHLVAL